MTVRNDLEGCAELDRLLAGTRTGMGGCLILRGGPDATETALLEYAVDRAGDMRTVRVSGVAPESEFRFAALHQMLAPFLAGLSRLPSPQRHALRGVVGLAHDPDPDRFLVGLAVLTLLAGAAGERPLLIVVDDAQWIDQASAEVLAFVARRLRGEPIAVVVALRVPAGGSAPFAGLPGRCLEEPAAGRSAVAVLPQQRCAVGSAPGPVVPGRFPAAAALPPGPADVVRTTALRAEPGGADAELFATAGRGPDELFASAAGHLRDGAGAGSAVARSALTVLDLAAGRYPAALARALDIVRDDPPEYGTRILPDLVEAASRTGDRTAATAALDRLAERAVASGTPLALGLLARARALLADGPAADGLYREARAYLEQTGQTPQIARTRLLHGEWLRRRRRHRDAREHLVAAAEMFEAMGMEAFLRRTRVELRATGERAGRRGGDGTEHLTPQEAQIAALVADGLTNREIASRLFISSNTVEYHLQKVFRKFAVTSRTQLTRALLTANPAVASR